MVIIRRTSCHQVARDSSIAPVIGEGGIWKQREREKYFLSKKGWIDIKINTSFQPKGINRISIGFPHEE